MFKNVNKKHSMISSFFKISLCLMCAFLCCATQIHKKIEVKAPGKWVQEGSYNFEDIGPREQLSDGVYYLLLEQQVNVEKQIDYYKIAFKILNKTGVQDYSELDFDFDPTYQKILFHSIEIIRNEKTIDKLELNKFKVIQREQELDRYIYDGTLSAIIFLDDVRVGDIVLYSFSRVGYNPINNGKFYDYFTTQWSVPVYRKYYRLLFNSERNIKVKNLKSDLQPETIIRGKNKEYIWNKTNISALTVDDNAPHWWDPYPKVIISDYGDWGNVVDWALNLYKVQEGTTAEIDRLIKSIQKKSKSKEEILQYSLKFVQDDVRYLGIEFGTNSHEPSKPSEVMQRRFGDCKDKAQFLCFLLNKMGIKSYPALLDTNLKDSIQHYMPSPFAFNHVVVNVDLNGNNYWIDPTRSFQGGKIGELYFPNYKKGLIIKEGNKNLSDIILKNEGSSYLRVNEEFDISDYHNPGVLHLREEYSGKRADLIRSYIDSVSSDVFLKDYLEYYSYTYPNVENINPISINDDEISNLITIEASFEISGIWELSEKTSEAEFNYYCKQINREVNRPSGISRAMPYSLNYPNNVSYHVNLLTPKNYNYKDEEEIIDTGNIYFKYSQKSDDNKIQLQYDMKNKRDHVPAAEIKNYIKNLNIIRNKIDYYLAPKYYGKKGSKIEFYPDSTKLEKPWITWRGYTLFTLILVTFLQFVLPHYVPNRIYLSRDNHLIIYGVCFFLSATIMVYDYYYASTDIFIFLFVILICLMFDQLRHITKL